MSRGRGASRRDARFELRFMEQYMSARKVAKAYAIMGGRDYVIPDDVKQASLPVLRHRIQVAPEVAISGQNTDDLLSSSLEAVGAPRL